MASAYKRLLIGIALQGMFNPRQIINNPVELSIVLGG